MRVLVKFYSRLFLISLFLISGCQKEKVVAVGEACCGQVVLYSTNAGCYMSIPNFFTPNGDGKNDFLSLHYNASCSISGFRLKIENYKVDVTLLDTQNPDFTWQAEVPTSGFAVYKLSLSCTYNGKSIDVEQPIAIFDQRTYLYNPIYLECCSSCVLPDMFVNGSSEPTASTAEGSLCE